MVSGEKAEVMTELGREGTDVESVSSPEESRAQGWAMPCQMSPPLWRPVLKLLTEFSARSALPHLDHSSVARPASLPKAAPTAFLSSVSVWRPRHFYNSNNYNSEPILSTYSVLNTKPSILHESPYLIFQ